jgi:tetratricopeptide (TPR) repeat protein
VALGKTGEELVNIKIQELALNKLLVLNYSKSDFRLVIAHYHLGEAYLSYECLEQAIEHISVALHKNEKLMDELPKIELLQINMQIALAEAFISQNNYDDAIEILNKARSL